MLILTELKWKSFESFSEMAIKLFNCEDASVKVRRTPMLLDPSRFVTRPLTRLLESSSNLSRVDWTRFIRLSFAFMAASSPILGPTASTSLIRSSKSNLSAPLFSTTFGPQLGTLSGVLLACQIENTNVKFHPRHLIVYVESLLLTVMLLHLDH